MVNPTVSDPAFMSATRLAGLVRSGGITSTELLAIFTQRIERLGPAINAVVVQDFDAARRRAQAMDALPHDAPQRRMPLFGVPMTVKESFNVTGLPTTWGVPTYRNNVATTDATVVERLRAAGANVFGKTNVPVMLADWQTNNSIYGTTNNPWDLTKTPGGSSGGAAAALAAGLTALEVGSDLGGSIRNPAHYCGVYGHKPTWGICSPYGHALEEHWSVPDVSVVGPLARSADDLQLALNIMAGPDDLDVRGWRLQLPGPSQVRLSDYRVAVLSDHAIAPVDAAIKHAIDKVADFFSDAGAKVSDRALPAIDMEEANEAFIRLIRARGAANQTDAQFQHMLDVAGKQDVAERGYAAWQVQGVTMRHRDWLVWHERRNRMRRIWAAFFQDWDVLLCPAAATTAVAHNTQGERWERMIDVNGHAQPSTTQMFWAGYAGVSLLPATVAPIGLSAGGLPVGVQIIGPHLGDLTTIDIARHLENQYYSFRPPAQFGA